MDNNSLNSLKITKEGIEQMKEFLMKEENLENFNNFVGKIGMKKSTNDDVEKAYEFLKSKITSGGNKKTRKVRRKGRKSRKRGGNPNNPTIRFVGDIASSIAPYAIAFYLFTLLGVRPAYALGMATAIGRHNMRT